MKKNNNFGDLLAAEDRDHFYLMHLSYGLDKTQRERLWEYASKNHIIGLEHKAVKENWASLSKSKRKKPNAFWKGQFNNFCEKMEAGDYVVVLNGTSSILGIAKITEPKHRYVSSFSGHNESNPDPFFNHVRQNVEWIKKYPWNGLPLAKPLVFDGTLNRVTPNSPSPRWKVLTKIRV